MKSPGRQCCAYVEDSALPANTAQVSRCKRAAVWQVADTAKGVCSQHRRPQWDIRRLEGVGADGKRMP